MLSKPCSNNRLSHLIHGLSHSRHLFNIYKNSYEADITVVLGLCPRVFTCDIAELRFKPKYTFICVCEYTHTYICIMVSLNYHFEQ